MGTHVEWAEKYAKVLKLGENGTRGLVFILESLPSGADFANAAQAFNALYRQGKKGKEMSDVDFGELLSPEQRDFAYQSGLVDGRFEIDSRQNNEDVETHENDNDGKVDETADEAVDKTIDEANDSSKKDIPETITPIKNLTDKQSRLVKLGEKLGVKVVFADIKKGKENIDGKWDGKVLYINPNPNSKNPYFVLFKHELTHFVELSPKYANFLKVVADSAEFTIWLNDNGFKNMDEYTAKIISDYKRIGKKLSPEMAKREAVANFVGDVLFKGDKSIDRFMNELTGEHKRTFGELVREFIDWIKEKLGNIDEVAMLEKMYADLFKDAKNVRSKGGVESAEASYSISPSLESELDKVLNGTFKADKNEVYLGETSNFMTDVIGAEALSLYMPASKAYSSLVTEEEYIKNPYYKKQDNYHGIGKADFIEILEKSEEPILAFASAPDEDGNKRQNRIVLVTDKQILDLETGNYEYAVVVEEVDTTGWHKGKSMKANKTITIYPRSQLKQDVINAVIDHRILHTTKKGEHLFAGLRGSNPQGAIRKDVLEKNIAYFWANVKWEKQKNKNFSTKEAEMPSAFRLALEKAGYFDQDGHNKYMQENEELSQEDASVDKSDDGQYSYSPENNIDNYTEEQYNDFGWVRANNVINAGYWKNFTENFARAITGNGYYPKNKRGEYMIDVYDAYDDSGVTDVIVFASGTIESPTVTKIVKIDLNDDIDIETKRRNLYEAERRGIQQKAGELFIFYNKTDFIGRRKHKGNSTQGIGNNYGLDVKRSRSEITSDPIVELHVDEERETVTITYRSGEVVTEKLNSETSSYSYTPPKEELSNREILANMLDSVAESDTAKRMLSRCKESLARVQENEIVEMAI